MPKTYVLVADGRSARLLEACGRGRGLRQRFEMTFPHPRSREIMADRPGRAFDSRGEARHAMEPQSDPARVEEEKFLRQVSTRVERLCRRNGTERLVLVCPPRALGEVRRLLGDHVRELVAQEIGKDLTRLPLREIAHYLKDEVPC